MTRPAVRLDWARRPAAVLLAVLGAHLVQLGATGFWAAAAFFPWPWREPHGAAAVGGLVFGGGGVVVGLLFAPPGLLLLALAWWCAGFPRRWPWRVGRG